MPKVALLLNKSDKTIYRKLSDLPNEMRIDILKICKNENNQTIKYFTENGLKLFCDYFGYDMPNITLNEPTNDFYYTTVIDTLTEQLKVKDSQIQLLQEQVNTLLEQSKNFQVLLQGQQVLSIKENKKPFILRLFSRRSDFNDK